MAQLFQAPNRLQNPLIIKVCGTAVCVVASAAPWFALNAWLFVAHSVGVPRLGGKS